MGAYSELLRPKNGILAVLGIIIGTIVAGIFSQAYALQIVLAMIVSFLVNGAGNVINDYFDHKIDKINRPDRPIPSGRISRSSALHYFLALIIISLALSYFVSRDFLIIAAANIVVSFAYSWKLKPVALIGNIAVSWLAASTFIAAALIGGPVQMPILILSSIAFLGTLSREIFKDAEDVKGDKKYGAKTLPIVAGEKAAKAAASAVLVIGILSLLLPAYLSLFSIFYYIGMAPAVLVCLAAIAKMKNAHKAQKSVKIAMYFVFLGFLLGTIF